MNVRAIDAFGVKYDKVCLVFGASGARWAPPMLPSVPHDLHLWRSSVANPKLCKDPFRSVASHNLGFISSSKSDRSEFNSFRSILVHVQFPSVCLQFPL